MNSTPKIMGIVNITPDSFYNGSRNMDREGIVLVDKTLARVEKMIEDGAGYIDIGACSTRPGAECVDCAGEWARLKAVLRPIREAVPDSVKISIDTFRWDIISRTLDEIGEVTVNDISAGEDDPQMLRGVAANSLEYIAMHKKGVPADMQSRCDYRGGVVEAVREYFRDFGLKAEALGIKDWILDPGFGFAKTVEQNYELLEHLEVFAEMGQRILVGISRKSMIYKPLGLTPEDSRTLERTTGLHRMALRKGADILRVHDVAEAVALL
ncbi:MAG: dihydropteroate synthase [Candidatus Cryptobacteroides sp.]